MTATDSDSPAPELPAAPVPAPASETVSAYDEEEELTDEPAEAILVSAEPRRGILQIFCRRWGTLLMTFLAGFLVTVVYVHLIDKFHVGRVQMQLMRDQQASVFGHPATELSPNWLQTEYLSCRSDEALLHVVRSKGLAKRWRLGNDDHAATAKLRKMVHTKLEKHADVVTLEVYSTKPDEAAELANALADSYEERQKDFRKGRMEGNINMLQMELDSQEKKVEEKRVNMLTLMKKYGIVDFAPLELNPKIASGLTNGAQDTWVQQNARITEYEAEVTKLRLQLKALGDIKDADELLEVASGMSLEGITIKSSLPKFQNAKLELAKLTAKGSPPEELAATQIEVETLRKELAMAIAGLKRTLETKVEIAEAGLKSLQQSHAEHQADLISDKARHSEYLMAKREYEQQFALLNEMRPEILKWKVNLEMPMVPVLRLANAYPSPEVSKPNTEKLVWIGSGIALLLGLALCLILEYCRNVLNFPPAPLS